jgi:lipopolysaccharide/colanic/teichoic acid biosynthesis glycosyltransferase
VPAATGVRATSALENLARRCLDISIAAAGLVVASPLLGMAALAIRLEDGGPVIYRRRVLGLGGSEFDAFKLRTMRTDAHRLLEEDGRLRREYAVGFKLKQDPRVTPVGRFLRRSSIDELPQLVNVLRGQMTLVGPRMVHPPELASFGDLGAEILKVKPGLTGLWQVSGRQDLSFADHLELDRRYLRTRSLWLDVRILLRTVPAVLGAKGAY